jgi:hypothetical protein
LLILTFFVLTPVALSVSIFALISSSSMQSAPQVLPASSERFNLIDAPEAGVSVYAALPGDAPSIDISPKIEDARAEIIRQYLYRYDSPLEPFATRIVELSDEYNLDFRLTTAIAQQESNLCKKIPAESYNCWGWGIHSKGTLSFDSYNEALEAVTKGIREDYVDENLFTIEDIMSKWIPHSPEGAWAKGVSKFMEDME